MLRVAVLKERVVHVMHCEKNNYKQMVVER